MKNSGNRGREAGPSVRLRAVFGREMGLGIGLGLCLVCVPGGGAAAQDLPAAPTPNLVLQAPGGVPVATATGAAMPLGLDEAIERGMRLNLQQLLAQQNERSVHGQIRTVENNLLPSLSAQLQTGAQELNLAALGFKPSLVAEFGFPVSEFAEIVKIQTTSAQLNVAQQLFNLPAYEFYRAAQKAALVAGLATQLGRGNVALEVGTTYLQAIADAAEIANAEALEKADEVSLRQARLSHDAGVGTNLDALRAQVQLQTQQQVRISAENQFGKDKIALNRLIGLPADQQIVLTDTVPFAAFSELTQPEALTLAFTRRKDYLELEAQLEVAERSSKAVRYQRFPTLAFGGFYGVLGQTTGLYHGDFTAQGKLQFPIFEEASLRGEREVASAQISQIRAQIANLRVTMDQQIRSSMLDVQSSAELVKVAQSNVELSKQEQSDAEERFRAGVTDNLPLVEAQATLSAAQSRLIQSEFQYNQSKLMLARNIGVVETQYKAYLGR